uniref:hypothetical protein n=1 Tax=Flavobacterium sp. TaxID=239 RepID=UPI00404A7F04
MKKIILILLTTLTLSCCNKDDIKTDPTFALPPETQTGANTFGVTINGKVYIPRDPTGTNWSGPEAKGMYWYYGGLTPNDYNELVVVDGASITGFKIVIHIQYPWTVGSYSLKQSNFQNLSDSISETHIFFKIWNNNIKNYVYYGSMSDEGEIIITRRDNGIISGSFSGKFVRYDNPNEFIQITDGRFDINSFTLQNTPFP